MEEGKSLIIKRYINIFLPVGMEIKFYCKKSSLNLIKLIYKKFFIF